MKIPLSHLDLPEKDLRASIDEDALDELAASMRDHGQLQPIGVKPKHIVNPADEPEYMADFETNRYIAGGGRFEVVFGARRTRAARLLAWPDIEANLVSDSALANPNAKKLIENVQRLDMTPMEEAYGLLDLIGDATADVRKLQSQTGKSREWVRTRLALVELPEDLQGAVQAGVISIGVARAFGEISNPIVREQYITTAVQNGCTAEQAKIWAGYASAAESGIMTMDGILEAGHDATKAPPPVDLQYHCFICSEVKSWRRTNTLIVCADCQDAISSARKPIIGGGIGYPLETAEELV